MKVLVQVQNEMLSDILAIALEGVLCAECSQAASPTSAAEILAQEKNFDLVVLESDQADSEFLFEARRRKVPIIRLVGSAGDLRPGVSDQEYVLVLPLEVKDFLELAQVLVKADRQPGGRDFCPVRLGTLLMAGTHFDSDAFLRLSEEKYLRVCARGDVFDGEKYSHFHSKGIKYLYIPREQFVQYLSSLAHSLQAVLSRDDLPIGEALSASVMIYESVRAGISAFGITPENHRVLNLTVNLAVRSIEKNPKLNDLFRSLSVDRESFQAWHSIAICYISCKLSSLMTWDSQNTHFKLALAGMLHDVALPNPDWALFETEGDLSGLTASEREEYRKHPLLAGEMASQLADFPGDVDYIIAQHHELPDGSGFPLGLNHTKISPLSSLFIVSHDICHRLYVEGENFDFARFLKDFDRRYPLGYFRKIRSSLEALDLDKN